MPRRCAFLRYPLRVMTVLAAALSVVSLAMAATAPPVVVALLLLGVALSLELTGWRRAVASHPAPLACAFLLGGVVAAAVVI